MNTTPQLTLIRPFVVTDAKLISSNVSEDDYPQWSAATTYDLAARVIVLSEHAVYESAQGSNLGNNPVNSTSWIKVGPTNRWLAFDGSRASQTKQSGSINYVIQPGQVANGLAVLNLESASELTVRVTSASTGDTTPVYERSANLSPLPTAPGWWEFFYSLRQAPSQAIFLDLPSYADGIYDITLTGGSNLAVGVVILGQQQSFASGFGVRLGARVGIQDYSRKEANEFGERVLIERGFARRANFNLTISEEETDYLDTVFTQVRAKPCLWIGSKKYECTTIFGIPKTFDILINYGNHSDVELEIEGIT